MVAQTFHHLHVNGADMPWQFQKPETDRAPPAQPTETEPEQKSEDSDDSLASWDGPVWDSRYGRFESQEDVAIDDRKGSPLPTIHCCLAPYSATDTVYQT